VSRTSPRKSQGFLVDDQRSGRRCQLYAGMIGRAHRQCLIDIDMQVQETYSPCAA